METFEKHQLKLSNGYENATKSEYILQIQVDPHLWRRSKCRIMRHGVMLPRQGAVGCMYPLNGRAAIYLNETRSVLDCGNGLAAVGFQRIEYMAKDLAIHIRCPQEVEVLISRNGFGNGIAGQTLQHNFDVDEAVAVTIQEDDGSLDVASWVFDRLVETLAGDDAERSVDFVVVELEALVADNLKPVHNRFGACEGI